MSLFRTGKGAIVDPVTGKTTSLDYDQDGKGMLPFHEEHPHWSFFNTHLHSETATTQLLTAEATRGSYTLTVANSTGFPSGKLIIEGTAAREPDSIKIMGESAGVITLAKPLDNTYPVGTQIRKVSLNMAVNGSVTPVSFVFRAPPGPPVHIETINWYIKTPAEAADSRFGGGPPLPRGMYMREVKNSGAFYRTIGIYRINQRFRVFDFDVTTGDRANPADSYWTWAKINLLQANSGIVRLDHADGDYLEALVQDDLTEPTDYTEIECAVGGHFEL